MKVEEDEDKRRKKRVFPQALVGLQASPNVYFELQNVQDEFPSRKQEDKYIHKYMGVSTAIHLTPTKWFGSHCHGEHKLTK